MPNSKRKTKNSIDLIAQYRKEIDKQNNSHHKLANEFSENYDYATLMNNYFYPSAGRIKADFNFTALGYTAGMAVLNVKRGNDIGKNLAIFFIFVNFIMPRLMGSVNATEVTANDIMNNTASINLPAETLQNFGFFSEATHTETLNFPIKLHPGLEKLLQESQNNQHPQKKLITELKKNSGPLQKQIKRLLPQIKFHSKILKAIEKFGLTIHLTHPKIDPEIEGRDAFFAITALDQKANIFIAVDKYSDDKVMQLLRNEFHHAALAVHNNDKLSKKAKRPSWETLEQPFLDKSKTKTDPVKVKKVKDAISEFKNNVARLSQKENSEFYNNARKAITDNYQPKLQPIKVPKHVYDYLRPSGYIIKSGDREILKQSATPNLTADLWIEKIKYENNIVMVYGYFTPDNTPDNTLKAFIADFQMMQQRYSRTEIHSSYGEMSEVDNLLEMCSEIDELDPAIKKVVCPSWCDYFSSYFEIDSYCVDENSSNMQFN